MRFCCERDMAWIFADALISRSGRNGGNTDFPVAEVKLIWRLARLLLRVSLVGQFADEILHV
jgi:hypothetical protein